MKPQLTHISFADFYLKPIKVTEELSAVIFAFTMFNHQQPGANPIIEANSSNRIYQTLWNEHPSIQSTRCSHSSEKIGKKIRDAEVSKIPCMIVIGQKEQESGEVSLRRHRIGDDGRFSVSGLIEKLKTEITGKS